MGADRSRTAGVLYAEDFDDPPPAATPAPPPEPMFDAAQLAAAEAAAHAEGVAAGEAQARTRQLQATADALGAIAAAIADADAVAARAAEQAADALAGLLLACLRRALPELCRLHGAGEARAVARAVLPGLLHEPAVTIRAEPATAEAVAAEIAAHEPDLSARLRLQPSDRMAPGDVRIAWADGYAQRDVAALWRAIAAALAPAGLQLPAGIDPTGTTEQPGTTAAVQSRGKIDANATIEADTTDDPRATAMDADMKELEHAG